MKDQRNKNCYWIWKQMLQRCYDPRHSTYQHYGARGIYVCTEWETDFHAFREWVYANGYDGTLDLDRIDNDGPYSPENCRFVTHAENCNNRGNNRRMPLFGEVETLQEWTRDSRCVVENWGTVRDRVYRGWPLEKALRTPAAKPRGRHVRRDPPSSYA